MLEFLNVKSITLHFLNDMQVISEINIISHNNYEKNCAELRDIDSKLQ